MTPSVKRSLGVVCFGVNVVSGAYDVWFETRPEWTAASEALLADKLIGVCGLGQTTASFNGSAPFAIWSANSTLRISVSQSYL